MNELRFVVAVDPSEVPHYLRGAGFWGWTAMVFSNIKNAKDNKRRSGRRNLRLFEVVYDPADGTANALRVTSEIE